MMIRERSLKKTGGDYETLKAESLGNKRLFEDPDFPAVNKSIFFSKPLPELVKWKRPLELCPDGLFIADGVSRFDLVQSPRLGNCWFVAAASVLASHPALFEQVVPTEQSFTKDYAGIFRFFFWQFGDWYEVVIDDRLPVRRGGNEPLFCQNVLQPKEFWSALLEKAYAKLYGSYESLEGGKIQDALVDFTGGAGEVINLSKPPRKLFRFIQLVTRMNNLMGCSIQGDSEMAKKQGLISQHAYCITGVTKVPGSDGGRCARLLRLRDPYGRFEWTGAWSDGSVEWKSVTQNVKEKLGLIVEVNGEFWMPFEEWRRLFSELQVCYVTPQTCPKDCDKSEWCVHSCRGAWERGRTAGGCGNYPHQDKYWMNPRYYVALGDGGEHSDHQGDKTMVVSLLQRAGRSAEPIPRSLKYVGYDIFKIKQRPDETRHTTHQFSSDPDNFSLVSRETFSQYVYRELCRHHQLESGHYCIIPYTYRPNDAAEFYLRIITAAEGHLITESEGHSEK